MSVGNSVRKGRAKRLRQTRCRAYTRDAPVSRSDAAGHAGEGGTRSAVGRTANERGGAIARSHDTEPARVDALSLVFEQPREDLCARALSAAVRAGGVICDRIRSGVRRAPHVCGRSDRTGVADRRTLRTAGVARRHLRAFTRREPGHTRADRDQLRAADRPLRTRAGLASVTGDRRPGGWVATPDPLRGRRLGAEKLGTWIRGARNRGGTRPPRRRDRQRNRRRPTQLREAALTLLPCDGQAAARSVKANWAALSIHWQRTANPAEPPISRICSTSYLYELSVQMCSPASNSTVSSDASTFARCRISLTRCISMRPADRFQAARWRNVSRLRFPPSSRLTRTSRLRLNAAVTPSGSSYARIKSRSGLTRSAPSSSRSPGRNAPRIWRRNSSAAGVSKLPMFDPSRRTSTGPLPSRAAAAVRKPSS